MVATKVHNEIEFKLGMSQKEYDDFVANVEELFKAASADPSLATKWEPNDLRLLIVFHLR